MKGNPNDKDGDGIADEVYSYTLEGNITDAFEIDSSTGVISVKSGATLDYETKTTYTGKVKWSLNSWTSPLTSPLTSPMMTLRLF